MFCVEENLQQAFASFTLQFGEMGITDQFVFSRFSRGGVCDGKFLSLTHSLISGNTDIDFGIRLADSRSQQAFFPPAPFPSLQTMNWSSLVFTTVAIWGIVFYFVWARFRYVGPVEYVRKLD